MVEIISNFLQRTLTNLTLYDNDEATNSANESSTPSESTIIKFARFENGILRLFEAPINQTSYIAFSHVWGAWTWRTIAGIPYEVKASQEKADFIATDLPRIVGSGAFWMDTLTVDQRDEHEIAAIVDAIPVIFRSARKTIAVRECDGLYECCMDAVGDFDDHGEFHRRLYEHSRTHGEVLCVESYLQRLWTLQECLLSHTIEFYVASGNVPKTRAVRRPDDLDFYANELDITRLVDSLWVLAYCVSGAKGKAGISEFFRAYTHCGTVVNSRSPLRSHHEDFHDNKFLRVNLASHRSATMPRDYVFATMPAFPWYRYPKANATSMTFAQIYSDLFQQAADNNHAFTCKFTASMLDPTCLDPVDAWRPSHHLPSPTTLGDFMKLLGHRVPSPSTTTAAHVHVTSRVQAHEFERHNTADAVLAALKASMHHFPQQWQESHRGGELSKFGNYPDDDWRLDDGDAKRCGWFHFDTGLEVHVSSLDHHLTYRPGLLYHEHDCMLADASLDATETHARAQEQAASVPLFVHARRVLDHLWCATDASHVNLGQQQDWAIFAAEMQETWSAPLLRTLLLLGAMVTARVPLSAAAWVNKLFVPVYLRYSDAFTTLGLLARHARVPGEVRGNAAREVLSVGQHPVRVLVPSPNFGKDLVLVDPATRVPVGLGPDFLADEDAVEGGEGKRWRLTCEMYADQVDGVVRGYASARMHVRPLETYPLGNGLVVRVGSGERLGDEEEEEGVRPLDGLFGSLDGSE